MLRSPLLGLLLLCFPWLCPAQEESAATDDRGRELRLAGPAQRIVSLAPHTTELIYAVGAGEQLVGVAFSDYPPQASRLPALGGAAGLDVEAILALKPDLVVGWGSGNPASALAAIERLGLPLFISEPLSIDDIGTTLERLGRLTGHAREGRRVAAGFTARLAALRREYAGRPPLRVFYQVWGEPPMTVGRPHLITRVIELCGGRNLFDDLAALAPTVDPEAVLARDPQVIVASGIGDERPAWLDQWQRWPQLTAVRTGSLVTIPPELLQRHTPRLLEGAERLCRALETARGRVGG